MIIVAEHPACAITSKERSHVLIIEQKEKAGKKYWQPVMVNVSIQICTITGCYRSDDSTFTIGVLSNLIINPHEFFSFRYYHRTETVIYIQA